MQKSKTNPTIEPLREAPALRTAVSPQVIHSYDEKRSDYIERPSHLPNGMQQLAHALRSFSPGLNNLIAAKRKQFVEEQTAVGNELWQRNKTSWKELVASNPEYTGLNPHLERGYKAAELEARGLDFQAELQDFYTTSGLGNETDPQKIQESTNAFTKKWMATNVEEGGYEPELLANHFLNKVTAAEAALLNRHTNDRANEHLRLAMENHELAFSKLVDSYLENTPSITNPDVFDQTLSTLADAAINQMAEMEASGLPRSQSHTVIEDAIINLAKAEGAEGHGEELLLLADRIRVGTGTIGGKPSFKAKVKGLRENWEREHRQRRNEWQQQYFFNRRVAEQQAYDKAGTILYEAFTAKRPVTQEELVAALGPEHTDIAISSYNKSKALSEHSPVWDKEQQLQWIKDEQDILTGKMGLESQETLITRYGFEKAKPLRDLIKKVHEGGDPVTMSQTSMAATQGYQILDSQIAVLFSADNTTMNENSHKQTKAVQEEARWQLRNEIEIFTTDHLEKHNRPPSQAELSKFVQGKALEIGRTYQLRQKEIAHNILESSFGAPQPYLIEQPDSQLLQQNAAYWENNTIPYLWEEHDGEEMEKLIDAIKVKGINHVISYIQQKYGLKREQAEAMLQNQVALFQRSEKTAKK